MMLFLCVTLVGLGLTAAQTTVTCECGVFNPQQFSGGGGQSRPVPLEYIGRGGELNVTADGACDVAPEEPGPCKEVCSVLGPAWAENKTMCMAHPDQPLYCYNAWYCERLSSDDRVSGDFSCQYLEVRSRVMQCPANSTRGEDWSPSVAELTNLPMNCDRDMIHTQCDAAECAGDASYCESCTCEAPQFCRPVGCAQQKQSGFIGFMKKLLHID